MSNKSLETVKNWIDNQRMSFERKDVLVRLINDAVKEAEDDDKVSFRNSVKNSSMISVL